MVRSRSRLRSPGGPLVVGALYPGHSLGRGRGIRSEICAGWLPLCAHMHSLPTIWPRSVTAARVFSGVATAQATTREESPSRFLVARWNQSCGESQNMSCSLRSTRDKGRQLLLGLLIKGSPPCPMTWLPRYRMKNNLSWRRWCSRINIFHSRRGNGLPSLSLTTIKLPPSSGSQLVLLQLQGFLADMVHLLSPHRMDSWRRRFRSRRGVLMWSN